MPRVRRPYEEDEHEAAEPRAARRPGAAAAVLDLQRGYGNHAVTRMLARNPNPALERNPTIRPPKPPLKSGRDVDAIFDSSPFFKDLVGAKLKKLPLAKAMKLDAEPQFEAAWIEYAMRSYNPETQQKFTLEEAKAFVEAKGLRAFQDEDRGTVHIRKARADLRTQLHEGLHLFCDDRWKDRMGMSYNANEGFTQYFTRKLGDELGLEADDGSFLKQYTSVTHLVAAVGEDAVAAAYFHGDLAGLKEKVDGRGKGACKQWLDLLESNDFKGANKLMQ
jgi:hypothetical protein